jgi:hypothetical protein
MAALTKLLKIVSLTLMTTGRLTAASGWKEFGRERIRDGSILPTKRLFGSSEVANVPNENSMQEFLDGRYDV